MQSGEDRLRAGLVSLGLPVGCSTQLIEYYQILKRWNKRHHLVSESDVADPVRFVDRHILDSLAPIELVLGKAAPEGHTGQEGRAGASAGSPSHMSATGVLSGTAAPEGLFGTVVLRDVGSGGGLPGIPLAVVLQGLSKTADIRLIDRSANKVGFLVSVVAQLGLFNCTAHQRDIMVPPADTAAVDKSPRVIVTCRALSPWPRGFVHALERQYRGWLVYYAGTEANIPQELSALVESRPGEINEYSVPGLPETSRRLVILKLEKSR